PEIRPDQAVAITGSGKLFGDWKKMVLLSDVDFPTWTITLNVKAPFEYKFVIVDRKSLEPILWENGGNHFFAEMVPSGTSLVVSDIVPVFPTLPWRGAGTAIPVFSLRTADSFGVGEFHDLKKMVDWAVATGQNVLQLLPINDTTMTGKWQDSYPYNANTTFALHPQFIHLPAAGVKVDKAYRTMRDKLNALPEVDYEAVNNEKTRLLKETFAKIGNEVMKTDQYKAFMEKNRDWLIPYAAFCCLRDEFGTPDFSKWGKMAKYTQKKVAAYAKENEDKINYHCWVQFCLDAQLHDAVQYAHSHGVALKGDLPIGISRTSVDAWAYPELYHLDSQAGAPPDAFSVFGQNWGFPTYNWEKMSEDGFAWWKSRMRKMSEYFDAFRIDHILGFFRIWEIPMDAVHGLLGYFNPALPYSADEILSMGFDLSEGRFTQPPLRDDVIGEIFGDLASEVKAKFIKDGKLIPSVSTQRKVVEKFKGEVEKEERLREGFLTLLDDVLFIEDPRKKGYFHPRISAQSTYSFKALDDYRKATFMNLYNDFFYHRHN
ncbi:MAG: 4-alpha-glucanotransferase, partial [Bacteroidales bacterium]|nr:4-alpha-glucanotransferase [Bacteroidales bacterium]